MEDKRDRRPGELTASLLLVAFSLLAFWQAFGISGLSALSGAGVFPMLAAAAMVLSGLLIVRRTLRMRPEAPGPGSSAARFAARVTPRAILVVTAMIAAYMVVLEPLGFLVATFLFLLAAIAYLHRRGLLLSLLLSAGSLLVIWLVFRKVFTVVLPSGTLWPGLLPPGMFGA